ncbi:MAG: hypothetical protein COB08_018600 [Rhodobacteraceae bacterium]|nr:hypothetical protein [Paracoccaceae bacterium]
MGDSNENQLTAALMFKMPKEIGWSVQRGDQSWTGKELGGLVDCLAVKS